MINCLSHSRIFNNGDGNKINTTPKLDPFDSGEQTIHYVSKTSTLKLG